MRRLRTANHHHGEAPPMSDALAALLDLIALREAELSKLRQAANLIASVVRRVAPFPEPESEQGAPGPHPTDEAAP